MATDSITPDDLPASVREAYTCFRTLPDGRLCGVHRLLFHWTMHVDIDVDGYRDRYCYQTETGAIKALLEWSGNGDPDGWHRHPASGRRRDPKTGKEWIAP